MNKDTSNVNPPNDGNPPAPIIRQRHRAWGLERRCLGCGMVMHGIGVESRIVGPGLSNWCAGCRHGDTSYSRHNRPAVDTLRWAGVRSVHAGATSHDDDGRAA